MNAVLGDLISTKARHRGAAGFVVDGLVRDLPNIRELDAFPVFARGTTPIGPLHRGPGEINYPICCGGVVVNAGDIVVGDAMGVVVVPQGIAAELLERLQGPRLGQRRVLRVRQARRLLQRVGGPDPHRARMPDDPRGEPGKWRERGRFAAHAGGASGQLIRGRRG